MKLLCLPYAGGTSSVFLKWEKYSTGTFQVIPIDPPGRGRRMAEPLCDSIAEAVDDLKKQIPDIIGKNEEYAIYGHSMACLLIYELLYSLEELNFNMPVHVFLSGKNPPDVPVRKCISQLDDENFVKRVVKMGGMDADFFENQTLANLFIPILKKDFRMIETYSYKKKKQKLPVDMSFFFSTGDKYVSMKQVRHWADFIEGSFQLYSFEGKHFFIFEHAGDIIRIINQTLEDDNIIPY